MLTAVIAALKRHWIACLVAAVVTAATAFGFSFIMKPVYRVELTLSPVGEMDAKGGLAAIAGQLGGLMAASGLGLNQGRAKNEAVALLRSPSFIAEYIKEKNLMPVLHPDEYQNGVLRPGEKPPSFNETVKGFLDSTMGIKDDPKTGLITLRVDWTDPQLALTWARELVARVNEAARARDIKEATEGVEYLDQQLARTSQVGVRDAIGRVLQEQLQMSMLANVRREYAFRILDAGMIPDRPVRPRRVRMIVAGFALGAFVAGFWFCAREGAFTPRSATS